MPRPNRPRPPFDTLEKRLSRCEYLLARICETLKISYDLN